MLSIVGFLTFIKSDQVKKLILYLILLSIILEIFHLFIPERSFQWQDLFGNLFGVIIVIFVRNLIKKHELFKK
jgi:VanZ family protein